LQNPVTAASIGIISMVDLSTFMEHFLESYPLADGRCRVLGAAHPVISPCVGIPGAFATGSDNNSSMLFGSLQKNTALLQGISPELMTAAQTAGGSLGSMLAPVKLILGCNTVDQIGEEGQVLRMTVPWEFALGIALGALTYLLSRF
jgi:lactate permease